MLWRRWLYRHSGMFLARGSVTWRRYPARCVARYPWWTVWLWASHTNSEAPWPCHFHFPSEWCSCYAPLQCENREEQWTYYTRLRLETSRTSTVRVHRWSLHMWRESVLCRFSARQDYETAATRGSSGRRYRAGNITRPQLQEAQAGGYITWGIRFCFENMVWKCLYFLLKIATTLVEIDITYSTAAWGARFPPRGTHWDEIKLWYTYTVSIFHVPWIF